MHPTIILSHPQMGENIGAAARIMHNFGLSDLRIINPRDGWPNKLASDMARNASGIVNSAKIYGSLKEAVSDINILYATSARPRDMVKRVVSPKVCILDIMQTNTTKSAILFGPERTGLSNDDLVLSDAIVTIDVNPENPSLNLAQAVAIICYEWFLGQSDISANVLRHGESPLANKEELSAFLEVLASQLDSKGFFPAHMKEKMVRNLSNIFTRSSLTSQEIRTLRGVVQALGI